MAKRTVEPGPAEAAGPSKRAKQDIDDAPVSVHTEGPDEDEEWAAFQALLGQDGAEDKADIELDAGEDEAGNDDEDEDGEDDQLPLAGWDDEDEKTGRRLEMLVRSQEYLKTLRARTTSGQADAHRPDQQTESAEGDGDGDNN